jgi:Zn-dependent protease with chaperone function
MRNAKKYLHYLSQIVVTAWVGSLWAVGYLAVPVLFYAQPDRQLAGMLAGQMFTLVAYVGMFGAGYLLVQHLVQSGRNFLRNSTFWIVAVMLSATLLIQFVIQPAMADLKLQALPLDVMQSDFAARFKMMHGASSIIYLLQSLLGVLLIVRSQQR